MHQLLSLLSDRIASGLQRSAITTCSKWAERYRIMGQPFPGPWTFEHHPWLRDMCDCTNELVIGQKAAQMGFTEVALNKTFFAIDINGQSVLYVLPASNPDASDFSTSRFDPALEASEHLAKLFSDVKNIGHKRAGTANLFIRGSRSRSQMKSIPVGVMIFDEVDEMMQDNIPLAFERMSGQIEKQAFMVSTPTIDRYGINAYYADSTQDHFYFRCPHCNKLTEFVYPDCLVITGEDINDPKILESHLICKECKATLEHKDKINFLKNSQWVSTYTNRLSRGFHISQMYSMVVKPYELAISYLKSLSNPADEQEFYNSKLGITHEVEGARISETNILGCTATYSMQENSPSSSFITMGVDVGKWLHYEVDQWFLDNNLGTDVNIMSRPRILKVGKVLNFEELDQLMMQYRINFCVIDANPERRKALEFAQRFSGHAKICFYARGINAKQIHLHNEDEHSMSVDRTSWMDVSLGRFKSNRISLPVDLPLEYKEHIKAPVRIYEKDADGNPVGRYVVGSGQDHFAHARTYAELALPLSLSLAGNQNIGNVL